MGPSTDKHAVVNPSLQVHGIGRLRVVDASISKLFSAILESSIKIMCFVSVPDIPAAHTNGVVFMIGEKAADMVKDSWS